MGLIRCTKNISIVVVVVVVLVVVVVITGTFIFSDIVVVGLLVRYELDHVIDKITDDTLE